MEQFFAPNSPILLILAIWTLFWKGCALWFASKEDKRTWFVVLLIVNLVGILDIIYIFGVAKKKWSDVSALFAKKAKIEEIQPSENETPKTE